jgi:hypothetical protein
MTDDKVVRELVQSYRAMIARGTSRPLSSPGDAEHWRRLYRAFCPGSDAAEEDKFIRDVADIFRCEAGEGVRLDRER